MSNSLGTEKLDERIYVYIINPLTNMEDVTHRVRNAK
jgi:hypothetical protein